MEGRDPQLPVKACCWAGEGLGRSSHTRSPTPMRACSLMPMLACLPYTGDTVTIANCLERSAFPRTVQCSEAVMARVSECMVVRLWHGGHVQQKDHGIRACPHHHAVALSCHSSFCGQVKTTAWHVCSCPPSQWSSRDAFVRYYDKMEVGLNIMSTYMLKVRAALLTWGQRAVPCGTSWQASLRSHHACPLLIHAYTHHVCEWVTMRLLWKLNTTWCPYLRIACSSHTSLGSQCQVGDFEAAMEAVREGANGGASSFTMPQPSGNGPMGNSTPSSSNNSTAAMAALKQQVRGGAHQLQHCATHGSTCWHVDAV